jgi:HK97 family phage portal protein
MDFLTSLIRPKAATIEQVIAQAGYSSLSLAGVPVTSETALRISAVWACVRLISQSLASIPLIVYRRRSDGGRERAENHPVYELLHGQPNNGMTSYEFKRLLTTHALLLGNGYARIAPGPRGPVDKLIPIHPSRVTVEQIGEDQVRYRVENGNGQPAMTLLDDEMFHLRGLSWDGLTGVSVIEYGRQSMGLALATESHGARLFSQGATLGGVLTYPGKLSSQAAKNIRADWAAQHSGLDNAHNVAVFGDGITYTQVGMSNEDAQFLATREFQVADIARWFGVDLTLIQENSKSTSWGTGIEQLIQAFITFTLLPWAKLWEEAINRDMIVATRQYYAEYLLASLVRGDLKTRMEAYQIMINAGIKSRNEVRQLENDNPVPGLDGYDKPLNMGDATSPPAPSPDQERGTDAHYRRLVREAAERVVRKEMKALGAAAKRANGTEEWAQAVNEFYATHAAYVAESLAIPEATAELYATQQQLTLLEMGPGAVTDWLPGRAEHLAGLGLEAGSWKLAR